MFHTTALGSNHTPTDCSRSEKRVPPVVRSEWGKIGEKWTLRFGLKLSKWQVNRAGLLDRVVTHFRRTPRGLRRKRPMKKPNLKSENPN